ncbi:hypothetical protein [Moorena bouillonii]|uniref:hypothetical protein n=1 Tax=Moorena bouillonii TaxID=207920 RepID=UPI00117EB506|nr:hypothetical protein [Moorena bouillonii]
MADGLRYGMARRARQRRLTIGHATGLTIGHATRLTIGHATRSQKQNFLNQFSPSPLQMFILILIVVYFSIHRLNCLGDDHDIRYKTLHKIV